MGYKYKTPKGITIRSAKTAEISFMYKEKRQREPFDCDTTDTDNLDKLSHFRDRVLDAIKDKSFDYKKFFPDSEKAQLYSHTQGALIKDYLQTWWKYDFSPYAKASDLVDSKRTIDNELSPDWAFGNIPIDDLTWDDVLIWSKEKSKRSTCGRKRKNNILTILRSALNDAVPQTIKDNPLEGKKLPISRKDKKDQELKAQGEDKIIDPFSRDEFESLIFHATDQFENLIKFWRWTGLRSSELCALKWQDINWITGEVKICRGLTQAAKDTPETVKTLSSNRNVKLLPDALDALQAQKLHTYLADDWIFLNPNTETHFRTRNLRDHFKTLCKKAGVNYRYPYQLRHTYATSMISSGENILWVSAQLGHKDAAITITCYTKYQPKDTPPDAGMKCVDMYSTKKLNTKKKQSNT